MRLENGLVQPLFPIDYTKIIDLDLDFFGGVKGLDDMIQALSLSKHHNPSDPNASLNEYDDTDLSKSSDEDVAPIKILCIGSGYGTMARYIASQVKNCEMVIALEGSKGLFDFYAYIYMSTHLRLCFIYLCC